MKSLKCFLLLLFVGVIQVSFAQEKKEKPGSLRFLVGYNSGYFKDANFSPLNYTESGLLMGLEYWRQRKEGNAIWYGGLDFSPSKLKTPAAEIFTSDFYIANIKLGYLRKIRSTEKYSFFLGPQYQTNFNFVGFGGTNAVTFLGTHGLDLSIYGTYNLGNRHQVTSKLSVPLVFILARPPYSGWDKSIVERADNPTPVFFEGPITSLNKYFGIVWDTEYQYNLSRRWDLLVQYSFHFQKTKQLDPMVSLRNQFSVGLNLKF